LTGRMRTANTSTEKQRLECEFSLRSRTAVSRAHSPLSSRSTLRHLLTHSIGSALHFNSEPGKKFVRIAQSTHSPSRLIATSRNSTKSPSRRARRTCKASSRLTTNRERSKPEKDSRELYFPFASSFHLPLFPFP
jgi:hypothetical protein